MTAPASLITRLPTGVQTTVLARLSRNANAPGAGVRQYGRAPVRLLKRAGELGIILIESNVTGSKAANVGCVNPPNVGTVSLDTGGGTPASTDITTSEEDAVTWASSGSQLITVTAPSGALGAARVVV